MPEGSNNIFFSNIMLDQRNLREVDLSSTVPPSFAKYAFLRFKIKPPHVIATRQSNSAEALELEKTLSGGLGLVHLFRYPEDPKPVPLMGNEPSMKLELEGRSKIYLYIPPGITVDIETLGFKLDLGEEYDRHRPEANELLNQLRKELGEKDRIIDKLECALETKNNQSALTLWEHLKEGVDISHKAYTILHGLAKLLGLIM